MRLKLVNLKHTRHILSLPKKKKIITNYGDVANINQSDNATNSRPIGDPCQNLLEKAFIEIKTNFNIYNRLKAKTAKK